MTIYFAGSIRGGRSDAGQYAELVRHLQRFGQVLTEHIGDPRLSSYGETRLPDRDIFERDVAWLSAADVVVAEVTVPSTGVGYELGLALSLGKRVYCLVRNEPGKRLSAMVAGNPAATVGTYDTIDQAKAQLDAWLGPTA